MNGTPAEPTLWTRTKGALGSFENQGFDAEFLGRFRDTLKRAGLFFALSLGAVVTVVGLLTSFLTAFVLILVVAAVGLIAFTRTGRLACIPIALLGVLGVIAFFSGILEGGIIGNYKRGFIVEMLAFWVIFLGIAYLLKRDKLVALGVIVFIPALMIINLVSGIGAAFGVRSWAWLAFFIAIYILVLAWLIARDTKTSFSDVLSNRLLVERPGILVGAVVVGTYLCSWLLFGDPKSTTKIGLTQEFDGRFDQFGYGASALALAFLVAVIPSPPAAETKPEESEQSDAEALPETADPAARNLWAELTPEAREIFEEIYPELLFGEFYLQDEALWQVGLADLNLSEEDLEKAGLDKSRIAILAGDRFEREAIEGGVVRKNGSLRRGWQESMRIKNNNLLEEIGVDQDSLRDAVERRQAVEEKTREQENTERP